MFSQASVCSQGGVQGVCSGGGVSRKGVLGRYVQGGGVSRRVSRGKRMQNLPAEIRSTGSQYTSYWNALLFLIITPVNTCFYAKQFKNFSPWW